MTRHPKDLPRGSLLRPPITIANGVLRGPIDAVQRAVRIDQLRRETRDFEERIAREQADVAIVEDDGEIP